jgi:endonuclease/exonuclease/phosphatase (EEP) superfamily protein YafD
VTDVDTATGPDATLPKQWRGGVLGTTVVVALGLAIVGVLAVTVCGRMVRAPGPLLVVMVTVLPYLYTAVGAAVFAVWCVLPDRRSLPALLALVAIAAGVLWGPSFPARPQRAEGVSLTAISWNVQRFWGGEDDPVQCVIDGILEADPDVVTLLEISRDTLESVQDRLNLNCIHSDYFGTNNASRGGLAVCARRSAFLVTGSGHPFSDEDAWQYVSAEITGQGRRFNVVGVHLQPYWPLTGAVMRQSVSDLAQGEPGPLLAMSRDGAAVVARQGRQSSALLDRVSRYHDPTLILGDFNSTRDSALHTELRRSFVDTFARGSRGFGATVYALGWLPLRVDYIYSTPDFAVRSSRLGPANCSDHRPVISQLVLRDDER